MSDVEHARAAADPGQTLATFALDDLAVYTRAGVFAPEDSVDYRQFEVGRDDVHGVLMHLLARCATSFKFNMFGYDDDELDAMIRALVEDQHVYVQGTLDKSQSGGVHEKKILAGWTPAMRSSIAIGQSASHQISHTKGGALDGLVAFEGSTNWSASGEGIGTLHPVGHGTVKAQNNTLLVHINPTEVHAFATVLDEQHATVLEQQAAAGAP